MYLPNGDKTIGLIGSSTDIPNWEVEKDVTLSRVWIANDKVTKGVTKASAGNKYYVTITVNGKTKDIGSQ